MTDLDAGAGPGGPTPRAAGTDTVGMTHGFVSYSRRNKDSVGAIVAAAQRLGRDLWIDAEDIPPGVEWRGELTASIENAYSFIVCLSDDWLASVECRAEFDRAVEVGKRIVPVVVGPLEVDQVPPSLRALQWIEARGVEPDLVAAEIVRAIDFDHDRVRGHTLWLGRALRWEAAGEESSLLLRGRELRSAEDWLGGPGGPPLPTPLHTRFIVASRRGERRRVRGLLTAALVAVLVSTSLGVAALVQRNHAIHQRDDARSRQLASEALGQLDVDPERALLLARAAWTTAHTDQAVGALRATVDASRIRQLIHAHSASVSGLSWARKDVLVTSGREGTLSTWDAANGDSGSHAQLGTGTAVAELVADADGTSGAALTGKVLDEAGTAYRWALGDDSARLEGKPTVVARGATSIGVSADGTTIVVGRSDGSVVLAASSGATRQLDVSGSIITAVAVANGGVAVVGDKNGHAFRIEPGEAPAPLASYSGRIDGIQISSEGDEALLMSQDGSAAVLRVRTGGSMLALGEVFGATLADAGDHVATYHFDGRVFLYDVASGKRVQVAAPGTPSIDIAFSRDGARLAAGSLDGVTRVWRVGDQTLLASLKENADPISEITFSPEGTRLATGHISGDVRVWALPGEAQPLDLGSSVRPASQIADLTLMPRSGVVAVAPDPGLVGLFDIATGRAAGQGRSCVRPPLGEGCLGSSVFSAIGAQLVSASFSPDGALVALGTRDGKVGVWDVTSARQVSSLPDVGVYVSDAAFSNDGSRIVEGSLAGIVVANARTGEVLSRVREGHNIYAVAVTPRDEIVSVDQDGRVEVSSMSGDNARSLLDLGQAAFSIALDASGKLMAFGTESGEVRVTDALGRTIASLLGHTGFVQEAAFSRDGQLLVSGGNDGTARVWDVASATPITVFRPPGGPVRSVAVDESAPRFVTGTDGAAYVFTCEICVDGPALMKMSEERLTRSLTAEEKRQYLFE